MAYEEMETLPEYVQYAGEQVDGNKWSGKAPPPAIGDKVRITFNGLGTATVVKYFVQDGFLGVMTVLDNPPAWYVKQNKGNIPGHAFGAEIEPA